MQYRPPTVAELEHFHRFLLRSAKEVFGAEADDGRVIDDYTFAYTKYPRYGRLRDLQGHGLVLGDRFFRLGVLSNTFLAATHFGHDRYGILGEPAVLESVAIYDIEMSQKELDEYLGRLATQVHRIDPTLVIELDWLEMLNRGPSVAHAPDDTAVAHVAVGQSGTIMVRDIGVTKVALVRTPDGLALDVEGERSAVSETEANVFLNTSTKHLVDWALGAEVDRDARLGDLVSVGLREDLEYVFMDQSSFRNGLQALADSWLTPTRLFDLSSLAHHLVFADAIAVPSSCPVPALLQGAVISTDADEVRLSVSMHALSNPNGFQPGDTLEVDGLKQIESAWRTFLGVDVSLDYSLVDNATKSPGSWEYVVGDDDGSPDPAELLLADTGGNRRRGANLSEAVSIHTLRYILNERRAQLMGMPYAASALRYPVQAVRMRNALHFRSVVDHVLRPGAPPESHGELGTLVHQFRLPDALGVGCSQARARSEVLPRVMELRAAMAPFREAIRESRQLGRTDTEMVRSLRRPLVGLAFAGTVDTAVAQLSSVATATGLDLGTALLVAKLAKPLNLAQRATRLVDLIRRPHIRVLQRFSQLVSNAATTDDLFRLWETKPTRPWFDVAAQLSDLSAFESAKMSRF